MPSAPRFARDEPACRTPLTMASTLAESPTCDDVFVNDLITLSSRMTQ